MKRLFHFVKEKIPFALTGLVATGINFGVYLLLVDRYLPPGPATVIAYSSSVVLNFFLQRYFVFELNRSIESAFALSMLVSAGGLVLDWLIVTGLHSFPYLGDQEWVIKLAATGIVFFYNFYAKRRVFEGRKGGKGEGGEVGKGEGGKVGEGEGEKGAGPQVQSELLKSNEREGITSNHSTSKKRENDN